MNIHIANLNINLIESDLQRMFSAFGEVASVELIRDKLNNRSRGRAFVEMPVALEAQQAISSLDRTEIKGKMITVSQVVYDPTPNAWSFRQKR
jgi:RNA recognition motif-containing protein